MIPERAPYRGCLKRLSPIERDRLQRLLIAGRRGAGEDYGAKTFFEALYWLCTLYLRHGVRDPDTDVRGFVAGVPPMAFDEKLYAPVENMPRQPPFRMLGATEEDFVTMIEGTAKWWRSGSGTSREPG